MPTAVGDYGRFALKTAEVNSALGDLGVVAFTRRMREWDQQRLAKMRSRCVLRLMPLSHAFNANNALLA